MSNLASPVDPMEPAPPPAPADGHGSQAPSAWVRRWSHLVPLGGPVLDVACGMGRHLRWFAARGHPVAGVDRSPEAIAALAPLGELVLADLEDGPWPFAGRTFGGVVVTNYLWRPLLPALVQSLADGGVLLYETFCRGNETVNCCAPAAGCAWWRMKMGFWTILRASCSASRPCGRAPGRLPNDTRCDLKCPFTVQNCGHDTHYRQHRGTRHANA